MTKIKFLIKIIFILTNLEILTFSKFKAQNEDGLTLQEIAKIRKVTWSEERVSNFRTFYKEATGDEISECKMVGVVYYFSYKGAKRRLNNRGSKKKSKTLSKAVRNCF